MPVYFKLARILIYNDEKWKKKNVLCLSEKVAKKWEARIEKKFVKNTVFVSGKHKKPLLRQKQKKDEAVILF